MNNLNSANERDAFKQSDPLSKLMGAVVRGEHNGLGTSGSHGPGGLMRVEENKSKSVEDRDAEALDQAKKSGMSESDRRELWAKMWSASPDRQEEFTSGPEVFAAFMEGCFRGSCSVYKSLRGAKN